jgi:NTP pyrophosphatase (non-canonical NTP hydrolase)
MEANKGMTVREMQRYIVDSRAYLNFSTELMDMLCGLVSEIGEVASAIRREHLRGQPPRPDTDRSALKYEIADVYIYISAIADKLGVDLESVVPAKMKMNMDRYGPGTPETFIGKK